MYARWKHFASFRPHGSAVIPGSLYVASGVVACGQRDALERRWRVCVSNIFVTDCQYQFKSNPFHPEERIRSIHSTASYIFSLKVVLSGDSFPFISIYEFPVSKHSFIFPWRNTSKCIIFSGHRIQIKLSNRNVDGLLENYTWIKIYLLNAYVQILQPQTILLYTHEINGTIITYHFGGHCKTE